MGAEEKQRAVHGIHWKPLVGFGGGGKETGGQQAQEGCGQQTSSLVKAGEVCKHLRVGTVDGERGGVR